MVAIFKPIDTMGELQEKLGGIPAGRILLHPYPGLATEADVIAARIGPRKRLCELIDGVLLEKKAMGFKEGFLAGFILHQIATFLETHDLGIVAPGDSQIRLGVGLVRIPDVSFIPWSRIPGEQVPDEPIAGIIPTLAVEVLSKNNTTREIERKVAEYFAAGVKLVWVIDPATLSAREYTTSEKFKVISPQGVLLGGKVLPGFKLPLSTVFGSTKRRK